MASWLLITVSGRARFPGEYSAVPALANKRNQSTDYTARPRPQPNVTLAPEEPNVYRSNYESKTCAPAERDVSGNGTRHRLTFRSSGARRNLLEVTRSINIRSLRDEGNRLENLVKKQEVRPLYYT